MAIRNSIKFHRTLKNMSQIELASRLGVVQQTICAYENNIIQPPARRLVTLSHVLEVPIDDLIGDESADPAAV